MKKDKQLSKNWYNNFLLKETHLDEVYKFDFKLVNFYDIGYVFVLTAILIPFLGSIISTYFFTDKLSKLFVGCISFVASIIGCCFVLIRVHEKIIHNGSIIFYFFYFIPIFLSFIKDLILDIIQIIDLNHTISLLTHLLSGIICIILTVFFSPYIFKKIKLTIIQNYKLLIPTVLVWTFVIFCLEFVFVKLQSLIDPGKPINQKILEAGLEKKKWWNIILLFLYSVFLAPINEELACRHGIFSLCGNGWIGYFCSIIYFAGIHVISYNDWEHSIVYFGTSFLMTTLFIFSRANVTYTIFVHAVFNLTAFICLFI